MRIGCDLTLIDNTVLVVVEEFDRIFNGQNMIVAFNIDLIDHRGERGRFTRTGRASNKDQAARLFAHVRNYRRQTESVERLDLIWYRAENRADRAFLIKEIGTKARHSFKAE